MIPRRHTHEAKDGESTVGALADGAVEVGRDVRDRTT